LSIGSIILAIITSVAVTLALMALPLKLFLITVGTAGLIIATIICIMSDLY
jgi:hypothetical protein